MINKNVIKSDVVVYDNFLTSQECKAIIDFWKYKESLGRMTWNPISFYESYAFGFNDWDDDLKSICFPGDYFLELKKQMKVYAEEAMGRKLKEVSFHAQKWSPGAYASFHSDNSSNGEYNAFERSKFAAFIYLNDDFEGGELNFKDHPITIKPETGMYAVFAGGAENEHEVTVVRNSDRYTIGSFWDFEESEYSEEKQEQWAKEIAEVRSQQAIQQARWEEVRNSGKVLTKDGEIKDVQYFVKR